MRLGGAEDSSRKFEEFPRQSERLAEWRERCGVSSGIY